MRMARLANVCETMKVLSKTIIGGTSDPLMIRYVIVGFRSWGLYVHKFLRSDHDRALHDHPWPFVALILKGGYVEAHDQTIDGTLACEMRFPGDVLVRAAEWRHRVILPKGEASWSLVIVGRRQRRWGFFLPNGWCHWRQYNYQNAICEDLPIHAGGED